MNDNNIILLVGDLGAGTNMVKNILLLSEDVDWPANPVIDRLAFIKQNIYPDSLKNNMQLWLKCEYRLRNFNHYYPIIVEANTFQTHFYKVMNFIIIIATHF